MPLEVPPKKTRPQNTYNSVILCKLSELSFYSATQQVSNTTQTGQTSPPVAMYPCINAFFKRNLFCSQPHCAMGILKAF